MTDPVTGRAPTFRRAAPFDAVALRDLERDANLVALAHVFPREHYPFPSVEVLDRWRLVLDDPSVTVDVVDGDRGLRAFVAYDDRLLRHLAVHPEAWGTGLARAAVERAAAAMQAAGGDRATLWVLELNERARGLYDHLGWAPTGRQQECPWLPHPVELEYALPIGLPPDRT